MTKIVTIKIKTGGHLVNHIKTDSRYGRKIPNKKYSLDCRFSKSETNSRSEKHFILLQCLYLWLSNYTKQTIKNGNILYKKNTFLCLHLRPLRHTNKYVLSGMFLPKATKTEIGRIYLENIFSVVYVYKLSSIILTYPLYN